MKKIKFKDYTVRIYTSPYAFARMPEQPFGYMPKDALEGEEFAIEHMTGFVLTKDNIIRLLVHPKCKFIDLFSLVSHELGHKIEGGFKKNPPDKIRYTKKHEVKAEHYENFAIDAYNLTTRVFKAIDINY